MLPYRFTSGLDSLSSILSNIDSPFEIIKVDDFEFYYTKNNTNFLYMMKNTEKNYRLDSKNTFRSDIWWILCEFFPEVKSLGRNVLVGWTNCPEIFYHSNNHIITTNKICRTEFSLLMEWIENVTSETKRKQKAGGLKHGYRSWFTKRRADISRPDTGSS